MSVFLTKTMELLARHEVIEGAEFFGQPAEPASPVEVADRCDDGFSLGRRAGVAQHLSQLVFWNINCCFHASIIKHFGIHFQG